MLLRFKTCNFFQDPIIKCWCPLLSPPRGELCVRPSTDYVMVALLKNWLNANKKNASNYRKSAKGDEGDFFLNGRK